MGIAATARFDSRTRGFLKVREKESFTAKAAKATKMNFLSQFFAAFVAFVVKVSFFVSRARTSCVWLRLARAVFFRGYYFLASYVVAR